MKIAVTGSTGRIGSEIVRQALARGDEVVGIDRVAPETAPQGYSFVLAEATDYEAMVAALAGCDALIHMAAIPAPGRDPDHIVHNNNVVGSYNALRAALEHGIFRISQASSVNAIGHSFSIRSRYDYFPLDEDHPNYSEDPYSLSKWICEQQADAFVRLEPRMSIASMRFHWVTDDLSKLREVYVPGGWDITKNLYAYTRLDCAADACLRAVDRDLGGHEVFYIVAPDTGSPIPSMTLAAEHFEDVPIKGDMSGRRSFFSSAKAERVLGWVHPPLDSI
ncbi:MAG: NAD(P)-dependent oxidoreductase [Rubellimicrobium sp.]|nr:NAD(P)-dependent oxidoreductase [Rubellimicrobium sp.]